MTNWLCCEIRIELIMNIKVYYICENRVKEGDTVLDVCCGSGDLAFLLSEKVGITGKVCFPHHLFHLLYFLDYFFHQKIWTIRCNCCFLFSLVICLFAEILRHWALQFTFTVGITRWLPSISQRISYKLLQVARVNDQRPATRTSSKHVTYLAAKIWRWPKWPKCTLKLYICTRIPFMKFDLCRWIEGDAVDLPFSNSSFDAATIGYGLRNIVDRRKAMEEMYKVLKPGAKVSILDFNKSTSSLNSSIQVRFNYKNFLRETYSFFVLSYKPMLKLC